MEVIFILIGISILLASSFMISFIWVVGTGQYDDVETPAIRVLLEDKAKKENINTTKHE